MRTCIYTYILICPVIILEYGTEEWKMRRGTNEMGGGAGVIIKISDGQGGKCLPPPKRNPVYICLSVTFMIKAINLSPHRPTNLASSTHPPSLFPRVVKVVVDRLQTSDPGWIANQGSFSLLVCKTGINSPPTLR